MLARASVLLALALATGAQDAAPVPPRADSLVARFHARIVRTPTSYRARRRLQAENLRFRKSGWLEVVTEFAGGRMKYTVTGRGGSALVQNRVLVPALEAEQQLLREGRDPVALTDVNYRFEEAGESSQGLMRIRLIPRRQDKRLLDGFLLVTGEADLVEIAGKLAKAPSFWTTAVTLTRRYGRVGDIRVPLSVSSVAEVRIAGRSTFSMTYTFEMVDGVQVGAAAPRH